MWIATNKNKHRQAIHMDSLPQLVEKPAEAIKAEQFFCEQAGAKTGKNIEIAGVFSPNLVRLRPSGAGWQEFHFQVAIFFRFMAANLSFTQFVTWAKPLYCV